MDQYSLNFLSQHDSVFLYLIFLTSLLLLLNNAIPHTHTLEHMSFVQAGLHTPFVYSSLTRNLWFPWLWHPKCWISICTPLLGSRIFFIIGKTRTQLTYSSEQWTNIDNTYYWILLRKKTTVVCIMSWINLQRIILYVKCHFQKTFTVCFHLKKDFEECVSYLNVSHHNRLAKELLNIVSKIMDAWKCVDSVYYLYYGWANTIYLMIKL